MRTIRRGETPGQERIGEDGHKIKTKIKGVKQ